MFYFCHLKKLIRPETFGLYYVRGSSMPIVLELFLYTINALVCGNKCLSFIFGTSNSRCKGRMQIAGIGGLAYNI